jgi:hypothetical protein
MNKRDHTQAQATKAAEIAAKFGIDKDRILFLNDADPLDAWIPPDELLSFARRTESFLELEVSFHQWVPGLNLVCYQATVINNDNKIFRMTGAAKLTEAHADGPDEHAIASGRALGAALRAAGFHPLKSGSALEGKKQSSTTYADEAGVRTNQLSQIHVLAEKAGLIINVPGERKNMDTYRAWLTELFGTPTAAVLSEPERTMAIAELRSLVGETSSSTQRQGSEEQTQL